MKKNIFQIFVNKICNSRKISIFNRGDGPKYLYHTLINKMSIV